MRVLLASVVVLALFAAGCTSPQAPSALQPGGSAVPAGILPTHGVFHLPEGALLNGTALDTLAVGGQYSIPAGATEPTVGIDPKGNVYYAGFVKGGGGPTVWKSADKGQTWKDVGAVLPTGQRAHPISFDPYVYVDQVTGRVFMDDIWPLGCGALSMSDDQGASWTNNPAACGNPQANDHQTLVTAKPRVVPTVGYPNVVYRCVNNVEAAACAMSYTGGLTFTPQRPVFTGAEAGPGDTPNPQVCGGLTGHLGAAPDGTVYLPRGACGYAEVAFTKDDGATWTTSIIDTAHPADDHEVSVAVDQANRVYAIWASKGHAWIASSPDGLKWTPAIDVTAPGVTAIEFNHIAAGAPGKIAVDYIGTTVDGGYEGKPTGSGGLTGDIVGEPDPPEWANASWNAYIGLITNATEPEPVIQTVTANDPADPIARGLCGHTRCHGMNDFIDLWIDAEGRPWGAFVDVCTKACVTDPTKHWDTAAGFVGTLQSGPALRGDLVALPTIAPPPAAKP